MNMFKDTGASNVDEYIEQTDPSRRDEIKTLHKFILKTIPSYSPSLFGSIIGYGKYKYRSKSGRSGEWFVVGLACQKNYISVYVCATDAKGYIAERYKDKFPKASIGRSCIRFKKISDIDLDILREIILLGIKYPMSEDKDTS